MDPTKIHIPLILRKGGGADVTGKGETKWVGSIFWLFGSSLETR